MIPSFSRYSPSLLFRSLGVILAIGYHLGVLCLGSPLCPEDVRTEGTWSVRAQDPRRVFV